MSGWMNSWAICRKGHPIESATITRRFGVRQGKKTRPIDNYTEQLHRNSSKFKITASDTGEAAVLHGADVFSAVAV